MAGSPTRSIITPTPTMVSMVLIGSKTRMLRYLMPNTEHLQSKSHVERRVRHNVRQVLWVVVAILAMLLGGFILFSLAINI